MLQWISVLFSVTHSTHNWSHKYIHISKTTYIHIISKTKNLKYHVRQLYLNQLFQLQAALDRLFVPVFFKRLATIDKYTCNTTGWAYSSRLTGSILVLNGEFFRALLGRLDGVAVVGTFFPDPCDSASKNKYLLHIMTSCRLPHAFSFDLDAVCPFLSCLEFPSGSAQQCKSPNSPTQ